MTKFSLIEIPKGSKIHFIGVGGVSMSGLAEILLAKGYRVTGSDIHEAPVIAKLQSLGMEFTKGHFAENVDGAALVVYTAAVKEDNPEMAAAAEKKLRLIPRSALLGAIMRDFPYSVAVAGTHGKTTVTSMISCIFEQLSLDPTILVGAHVDFIDGNVKTGNSDYFIAEACEYHRSFLDFEPYCATILNVEPDHLDYYKDADDYHSAYAEFLSLVSPDGFVVACADDAELMKLLTDCPLKTVTYGISSGNADFTAQNIAVASGKTEYDLVHQGQTVCHVALRLTGIHNILNSMAALLNAYMFGLDLPKAAKALAGFRGASRRFEYRGMCNGANVYDDYAHHPTEIKATLQAAGDLPHNRIICVFQPHTYSRTKAFFSDFSDAFRQTDLLLLADIYAAREKNDSSVSSLMLSDSLASGGVHSMYFGGFDALASEVKEQAAPGDIVLVMGAGDIVELTDLIIGDDNQ